MTRSIEDPKAKKSVQNKYVGVAICCGWLKELPDPVIQEVKTGKTDPYRVLDDFVGSRGGLGFLH